MYTYKYPRPGLTADIALFNLEGNQLLLIRRGNDPFKDMWALPGGFFDMEDSTIEYTAQRELEEETSLTGIDLKMVCVASREDRDPRGRTISVVYMGKVDPASVHPKGGDDAREARWFSLSELPPLAFDHAEIIEKAIAML